MGCGASSQVITTPESGHHGASGHSSGSKSKQGVVKKGGGSGLPPKAPTSNQNGSRLIVPSGVDNSQNRGRFASYASGASTPDDRSVGSNSSNSDNNNSKRASSGGRGNASSSSSNPKMLVHSTSAIGLDEMIEDRRNEGGLRQNVVHIEVPFGKPIEEVYDGVHSGPVLGSGISGTVRLVTHKATGIKYAVKVLDLCLIDNSETLKQLREEIFIMCQLDHPNIVRLEEVYESHSEIYLVQELCLGGELFDRLDEQPDYHYTEAECARLVKQMLSAVRYLHSRGIIHRDLKLENFLFSSTTVDSELKMIDFGLSKHFRYGEVHHEAVGTPYTVAPEVIRGSYDERCDLWAIGVIAFLLLSGEPPFGGCGGPEPLLQVRTNILEGRFRFEPEEIWCNVSQSARDFIKSLLVTDPKKRPVAREAQKHTWLQEWASRSNMEDDHVLNPNVVKALVNFKEYSDMRKLLCEVLSFTLLPDQIRELRREFEKIDTEGSGEISLSALKQVLMTNAGAGSLGALTEEEVEDIFNAMRVRKTDTKIHWHEFIAAGLSQCQVDDRNLRLAFERLDSDHKGYITLDDIMDLMGSDGIHSEEAMQGMWTDSIKAVKCTHARITYNDFLLLMKGQTKEEARPHSVSHRHLPNTNLQAVPEATHEEDATVDEDGDITEELPPTLTLTPKTTLPVSFSDTAISTASSKDHPSPLLFPGLASSLSPKGSIQSAPSTPLDHKRILEIDVLDQPLSIDEEDVMGPPSVAPGSPRMAGPGVPGTSASLTPPVSPIRGARDYVTPNASERFVMSVPANAESIMVPGLPSDIPRPDLYSRRRSRSVDDRDDEGNTPNNDSADLHTVADVVRDMIVVESGHVAESVESVVRDGTKSALQVNRKLYRAHRQMRLAVLEASKRFEEEQARHARDTILAQREAEGKHDPNNTGMIQAGLVMRHGHKKQVSSEAIRKLLEENRAQQLALVEKANKRGGRGRRTNKKTISDMSGMMTSMGSQEMGAVALKAAASDMIEEEIFTPPPLEVSASLPVVTAKEVDIMRGATVPGEFRKTVDPFARDGRYGFTFGQK